MADGLPIAVTMGDPAGIGGEIALMAWRDHGGDLPPFFLIDVPERLRRLGEATGIRCPVSPIAVAADAADICADALPVMPLSREASSRGDGPIESIDRAIDEALAGRVAGMVTNPVRKSVFYERGFTCPGHTEYLGERAGLERPPVMMLAAPALKVVPVTIHLALHDAIAALTTERIHRTLATTRDAMRTDFGLENPRIAVSGLNPHAGEDGHMGREEIDVIRPAIDRMAADGASVSGPLAADSMFHEAARRRYDVAVCMYHDQALIPLKTLDFHGGVNISLGLPFVRTSPDHGTACDIAGTGAANPSSLVQAIRLAGEIANRRAGKGAS